MRPKNELIRVVKDNITGQIMLDFEAKLFGRGAYVCKNTKCTALARKKKGFERHLKCRVTGQVYDECDKAAEESFEG